MLRWRRPTELAWEWMGEDYGPPLLIEGVGAPTDVKQGALGDCWLLSALGLGCALPSQCPAAWARTPRRGGGVAPKSTEPDKNPPGAGSRGFGAGALAAQSDEPPGTLRQNVTSPGGTTHAALGVLMADDGLQQLMTRAVAAATQRSLDLAD